MKRINLYLYQITCGILIFFFSLVFFMTLGNVSHMDPFSSHWNGIVTAVFFLSGAILLTGLLFLLTKLLTACSIRRRNICLLILAGVMIVLQLFMIFQIRPCLQCDALKPLDLAIGLLNGGSLQESAFYEYFANYPHNLPLTLYIYALIRAFRFLGFSQDSFMVLLQCVNLVLIDLALFAAWRFLKNSAGIRVSTAFACLCFLNPLLIYYPVFFYTQVLSMPIFLFLIVLFFSLTKADTVKKQIGFGILYGIALFFGYQIRFLTLIAPIACAMYLLFHKRDKAFPCRGIALILLSIALTFAACTGIQNHAVQKLELSTDAEQAFPIQHWIMMGLQGNGTYDYIDEAFTRAIPTKEERKEQTTTVLLERIQEQKLSGLLMLWGRKLSNTWADGYDDYASNLLYARHSTRAGEWLYGKYACFPAAYLHIYNCMTWLLLLLCAFSLLRKKAIREAYVFCIAILGGMIFHLFWEAGEQYSMPFAVLILLAAAFGFDSITLPSFQRKLRRPGISGMYSLTALCFVGIMLFSIASLKETTYEFTSIRVKQEMLADGYVYLENDQTLTQTITCGQPFNELTVQCKYYDEANEDAVILLRLSDSHGTCILEEPLPLSNTIITPSYTFDRVIPDRSECYTLELIGENIPQGCRGAFTSYRTGNWDVYPEGTLSLDENELENIDLCFTLSDHTNDTFL